MTVAQMHRQVARSTRALAEAGVRKGEILAGALPRSARLSIHSSYCPDFRGRL
jgi:hypothetical protein